MQIHVFVSKSHDPEQPLPAVALVPADHDVFAGDLAAQFARAGLTSRLVFLRRVDPGQPYPVLSVCDLEDDGVSVDSSDHSPWEVMQIGGAATYSELYANFARDLVRNQGKYSPPAPATTTDERWAYSIQWI